MPIGANGISSQEEERGISGHAWLHRWPALGATSWNGTRRVLVAVTACAVVVHLGALWNRFAFDDLYLVVLNPLVHSPSGAWRAFAEPYWPGNLTGSLYRPLTIATFALDWAVGPAAWFHAVNLAWHAAATAALAALATRWAGWQAGLVAGLVFAVHPVHVEAVANVVGRNELMAGLFTLLGVYAALVRGSVGWSAAAFALGILSKENAAVGPALVAWGWMAGVAPRPPRRRVAAFLATWVAGGALYAGLRWAVLHPYVGFNAVAPVFLEESAVTQRLTAVAALADVARLLLLPAHLAADYSPDQRTAVRAPLDPRFLLGLACAALWAALVVLARRRGRRVESFGLGWIGIALLPVANLLVPIGILVAERTLYLPSAGLALAAGAWLRDLPRRRLALLLGFVVVAGGARTAVRVPVWRDSRTATLSLLEDAPRSYRSWDYAGWQFLLAGHAERALEAFLRAGSIYPRDARVALAAADAAISLGRQGVADSLFAHADGVCDRCVVAYRNQATAARLRGAKASADTLLARAARLRAP
jgi:hypothetical protein